MSGYFMSNSEIFYVSEKTIFGTVDNVGRFLVWGRLELELYFWDVFFFFCEIDWSRIL